jgi:hypothetical protein
MKPSAHPDDHPASLWRRPATLAWATVVVIAVFYLLREHWGHVLAWWPYLVLMLCPLMHLLHGHGAGHSHHDHSDRKDGS